MKIIPDSLHAGSAPAIDAFTLPFGIVGFPDYTSADLKSHSDLMPFVRMRLKGPSGSINFVVVEPAGNIGDYEPEIFEDDARALEIVDPSDAFVLTIITMRPGTPIEATANLIGPIVVNRRTRIGRQLVIANYSRYHARHPFELVVSATSNSC